MQGRAARRYIRLELHNLKHGGCLQKGGVYSVGGDLRLRSGAAWGCNIGQEFQVRSKALLLLKTGQFKHEVHGDEASDDDVD